MQIKNFLFIVSGLLAASFPLYADLADLGRRHIPESEPGLKLGYYHWTGLFYVSRFSWSIDTISILYILTIVFAGCALLGACVLTWKKHEYNVPRQKKWYEWLISIIILFAPYLILFAPYLIWFFTGNLVYPGLAASVIVLCAAVGLVYELTYTFVMNREGIRNGSLRHWAGIEYLMIFACYSFVLLYRMLCFPGGGLLDSWHKEIFWGSLFRCFSIEYLVFWGLFFFFYLHRQKTRRYCYVLLHFCTVTGLISLITCFVFLFDGFTKMKVNQIKKEKEAAQEKKVKERSFKDDRGNTYYEDDRGNAYYYLGRRERLKIYFVKPDKTDKRGGKSH